VTDVIPLKFRWSGEAFVPVDERVQAIAFQRYAIGQIVPLIEWEDRSRKSHNHYFATLAYAWENLPEDWFELLATPEDLRAWALIRTGFRDIDIIHASTEAEAARAAVVAKRLNPFVVTTVAGNIVSIATPQSQSMKAMGAKRFQESKDAVLRECAHLLGVSQDDLVETAKGAAK